jgi:hypothetical protein
MAFFSISIGQISVFVYQGIPEPSIPTKRDSTDKNSIPIPIPIPIYPGLGIGVEIEIEIEKSSHMTVWLAIYFISNVENHGPTAMNHIQTEPLHGE